MEYTLSAFFVHRRLVEAGLLNDVATLLARQGFDQIACLPLTSEQARRVQGVIGNESFGEGARRCRAVYIGVDLCPQVVHDHVRHKFPPIDNRRLVWPYYQRDMIRMLRYHCVRYLPTETYAALEDLLAAETALPAIRATFTTRAAWNVVEALAPENVAVYRKDIRKRLDAFCPPFPVVRSLTTSGGRARTDVVRFEKSAAVCKTFRSGAEQFMRNELEALQLADRIPEIPPLLASGRRWFVIPYYKNARPLSTFTPFRNGLLPLHFVREAVDILKRLHEHGYAHLDFLADNILVDPEHGMKLIDFEFLHKYDGEVPPFEESLAVTGLPLDGPTAAHTCPDAPPRLRRDGPRAFTFDEMWLSLIGLRLEALLHDPAWKQLLKRWRFFVQDRLRVILGEQRLKARQYVQWIVSKGRSA